MVESISETAQNSLDKQKFSPFKWEHVTFAALTLNPFPRAGEGLQSGSPFPRVGEGAGRGLRPTS
jgi:hypothetical protein